MDRVDTKALGMATGIPPTPDPAAALSAQPIPRRHALFMGLGIGIGLIAGCSTAPTQRVRMPEPLWPEDRLLKSSGPQTVVATATTRAQAPILERVIPRTGWTRGLPDKGEINPMLPIGWVTVHHDGMDEFTATDYNSCAGRIELIRNGHRGKGWADIGYHFIVDRSGRVWEGRDLCWQGAHVKNCNEGNIGVLCLGNFDLSKPSAAQMESLERQIRLLMRHYKIQSSHVRSHKEWPEAATACPGRHLQSKMSGLRRSLA